MFRGQSMMDEIQALIEVKQQILLRHIVHIEYLVVVDLYKLLLSEENVVTSGKKGLQEFVTCKICLTLM